MTLPEQSNADMDSHEAAVAIDSSMADWVPDCHACHRPIADWGEAVIVATSSIGPDDEADGIAAIHRRGCSS